MTGPTVRIGLVGYGMGGRYFHAPLIAGAAGCELAGVVTRSTERRAELARDSPGVTAYDSLADLAATGVDAVVVSTPLHTHLPLVREAVGLGLPVVCDKPFAADAAAARATVELAARAGVLLSALQHRNGVTSHLWGSWGLQGEPTSRFRVIGSAGTYAVDSDDGQTDRLLAGRTPATAGDAWGSVPEASWGRIYRDGVGEPVPTEPGSWSSFYAGFASAVRGRAPVPVDPWDAVAALAVLDVARTSATQGRVVELNG